MDEARLYYTNPYLDKFDAVVVSCQENGDRFEVVLSQTAFYAEGGGQPGDTGYIGTARVLDTQEKDGRILHYCTDRVCVGEEIHCEIDFARRFDFMQNHSGEHILSGIIYKHYGFNNVGFHMGAETITIDFDGVLSAEQLKEIESEANNAVWKNIPFEISYPSDAELEKLFYRSKKELSGEVRIVTCERYDACACCGTHVKHSGEIGLIKILSCIPLRGGVRLEMVAGKRAYDCVNAVWNENRQISALLSAKACETFGAVKRQFDALSDAKYRLYGLEERLFDALASAHAGKRNVTVFESELSADGTRRLCDRMASVVCGRCAVFSGSDETGYKYAISLAEGETMDFIKTLNVTLNGKGGGKASLAQGSCSAIRSEIENFMRLGE